MQNRLINQDGFVLYSKLYEITLCWQNRSMKAIFFCTIILFFSCSVVDSYRAREFSFDDHDKQGRIILQVPKGFAEEKFLLGNTSGKEQYYYYDNGSLFYIAKNVTWE